MHAWYVLGIVGIALIMVGSVAVFIIKTSGTNSFEAFGIKIQSATPGGFFVALGVALSILGFYEGSQTKTEVTSVRLATDTGQSSAQYNVKCPIDVRLVGSIAITGDPGTVSYELDQQNGFNGPITKGTVETLAFANTGTENVTFDVPVTIPNGQVSFAATLVVTDPTSLQSDPVQIAVTCDSSLPDNPPSGPPSIPAAP